MSADKVAYVAAGFQEDCKDLMQKFIQSESTTFENFCEIWREMKFSLVFISKKTFAELLEFCEETLRTAKPLALPPHNLIERICGLYLLYGLYNKMPLDNVRIRVTQKEWMQFLDLYRQLKDNEHLDASYIFTKLVFDHAFLHCLFETEYGLEKQYKIRNENVTENPHSVIDSIVQEVELGQLNDLKSIADVYEEQKLKLLDEKTKSELTIFKPIFIDEIHDKIKTVIKKRNEQADSKRIIKETQSDFAPLDKSKYCYDNKIRSKVGHAFDTDESNEEESDLEERNETGKTGRNLKLVDDMNNDEDMEVESDYEAKVN